MAPVATRSHRSLLRQFQLVVGAVFFYRVEDRVDRSLSFYAATKKADGLMSETYAGLYRLPQAGLLLFVYGLGGARHGDVDVYAILDGRPIDVFGEERMRCDVAYINDIVACLDTSPANDGAAKAGGSVNPHRIYNIGNMWSDDLLEMIALIEQACGRLAEHWLLPMQPRHLRRHRRDPAGP